MNTKLLMSASAIIMGITGIALSFFPKELAAYFKMADTNIIVLQLLGGLYFGFAMLNWAAKANLTGGIYSRPVVIGNLAHFTICGLALVKYLSNNNFQTPIWIAVILYLLFAVLFGFVLFTNPPVKNKFNE